MKLWTNYQKSNGKCLSPMNSWATASRRSARGLALAKTHCGRASITPFNICASGYETFTTNLYKVEVNAYEKVHKNPEICGDCGTDCRPARFYRDAPVELVDTGPIRMACDHVLA